MTTAAFRALRPEEEDRLEAQRALVSAEISARYGWKLKRTSADIVYLQRLLDDRVFSGDQTYELQSLGVCFGDVLAAKGDLRWVIVNDEYGEDPTLRWAETSVQINVLTVLSKRVEDGDEIDVAYLAAALLARGSKLAKETS